MARRRVRAGAAIPTVATAAALVAAAVMIAGASGAQQGAVDPAIVRTSPPTLAAFGRYPLEERFVRDVYARLMRYDFAARQFRRVETGAAPSPVDHLVIRLSDIRTRRWIGQTSLGITRQGTHELSLGRREFCKDSDPCHAL